MTDPTPSSLLVIGASGLVGGQVSKYFRDTNRPLKTASHKTGADLVVDLDRPDFTSLGDLSGDIRYAMICGAVSSIDKCRAEMAAVRRFNVDNTVALLKILLDRDIVPIFCSSDAVFAGTRGDYHEDDERSPELVYGKFKKDVEDWLLSSGKPHLILRFGKLVRMAPDDTSPLGGLVQALQRGETVRAAHDQYLSLTDVRDVAEAVACLIDNQATGTFHIANPRPTTRLLMATAVAEMIGRTDLVVPVSISEFDFLEPRPRNPVLNSDLFRSRFSFEFSDPLERLNEFIHDTKQN